MRRAKLLPGLATSSKILADGTKQKYFYAWRGGPLLKAADGTPLQMGDPQFIVAYAKAHADRKKPEPGTLFSLIAMFKASSEFTRLAERTRKDYMKYLRIIEDEFSSMPIAAVEDRRARGKFKAWRDTFADNPRKADYCWTLLARVLSVAKDRGMIAVNVCERGGRLYSSDRAEIIWQNEHIEAFRAVASKELQFALLLALWTGQRQGDIVKLSWTQYDGNCIRLRQGKRKKHVVIPVAGPLKEAMDARRPEKPEGTILRNTFGASWTEDGFRTSWGKAFDKAHLADFDLHFHDLRGTAITRLAIAGCTVPQIAAITGHSMKDVERILQANYLGGQVQLADQAMASYVAAFG
ncbi:integrase [Tardiphaga alba]|uniref:Integrase n=1 Tax=Tardiphaga alba TaxID=340268 RepID=A0ABX8A9D0_9BRAD|nr:tyrosine-type recombinase/integrase [Tardiphaga alba]QUS39048.1 integrase [Tardiphaga alba]